MREERLLSVGASLGLLAAAGSDPARLCAAVVAGSYGASAFSCAVLLLRLTRSLPRSSRRPPVAGTALPLGANDALRSGLGAVEQFLIPCGLEQTGSRQQALAAYGTISGMVFPVLWFPAELLFALSELMVSETARLLARRDRARLLALVRKSLTMTGVRASRKLSKRVITGSRLKALSLLTCRRCST